MEFSSGLPTYSKNTILNYLIPDIQQVSFRKIINSSTPSGNRINKISNYEFVYINEDPVQHPISGLYLSSKLVNQGGKRKFYLTEEHFKNACDSCGNTICTSPYCRGVYTKDTYFKFNYIGTNLSQAFLCLYHNTC